MHRDGVRLRLGGVPMILVIHGLVFRPLQLSHPLVWLRLQGGMFLSPGLGLKAPSNVLATLSYPSSPTLAEQVLILCEPW